MSSPTLFCDGLNHVRPSGGGSWVINAHGTGDWKARRAANGVRHAIWLCGLCDYVSQPVRKRIFEGVTRRSVDELPIQDDYLGASPACEVEGCERQDTELNHTFPVAIDRDKAERYPAVWLCRFHHEEWGNLVTPHLNPPRRAT